MILISFCLAALAMSTSVSGQSIRRLRVRDAMRELEDLSDEMPHLRERALSMLYENDEEAGESDSPSLIGTSWRAVEIAPVSVAEPVPPITLSFGAHRVHGSAGCNHYRGDVEHHAPSSPSSSSSFVTRGEFATTKMHCEGAMERERAYVKFIKNGIFYYTIETGDVGRAELLLYDDEPSRVGEVLARFVEDEGGARKRGTPEHA